MRTTLTAALTVLVLAPLPGFADSRADAIAACAAAGERTWRSAQDPPPRMGCRELYTYALVLAEAGAHNERIEPLLKRGSQMHDRNPDNRSYGNFRWYWNDTRIVDYNAVEFCMQSAAPLWLRHKDKLTAGAREVLRETMELAAEGCLRHRVRPGYTNIALMNAQNLLLLGQALGKVALSKEGQRRLDRVCLDVWQNGVQEYVSPTYYGVDLDCLLLIEAMADSPRAVEQARALLRLMWTDIAANWYAPAQRLGGTRSRDYNYLRGVGMLDLNLQLAGWLDGPAPRTAGLVLPLLGRWKPPAELRELATKYPRTIRQSWGTRDEQTRTHYVLSDVSLSASSAGYHSMDLPLTVDIGRGRQMVRGYFIPDGRHDPYGMIKIAEGASGHMKALHLRPFWTAAQDKTDAVGVVAYRPGDIPEGTRTLESHFVLPREVDELWAGGRRVELIEAPRAAKAEQVVPLARGQALVIRKGTAAMGVKVILATDTANRSVQPALINDGNPHGAVRLTVRHVARPPGSASPPADVTTRGASSWGPRACFWIRAGGSLGDDDAFDRWRREFESSGPTMRDDKTQSTFSVPSAGGQVSVAIRPPGELVRLSPAPARAVLQFDGRDVGREILADIEPVRSWRRAMEGGSPIAIRPEGTAWEVEDGAVVGGMEVAADPAASGGKYVWAPGEAGAHGQADGMACYRLTVPQGGRWRLWGRVQTPTPQDDSFYVSIRQRGRALLDRADWHVGVHRQWEWVLFATDKKAPGLDLPAGELVLEIAPREDAARLDKLFLTLDQKAQPQ